MIYFVNYSDTRFSLQMKKQDAGNAQAACLSIIGDDTDQEFRDLKNLFELFDLDITERFFTIAHFRIKPDNSASIRVLSKSTAYHSNVNPRI